VTRARAEQLARRGRELGVAKRIRPIVQVYRRQHSLSGQPEPRIECGTAFEYAPVRRHLKRGEPLCELCRPVERVWSYAKHIRRDAKHDGVLLKVRVDETGTVIVSADDIDAAEQWIRSRRLLAHPIKIDRTTKTAPEVVVADRCEQRERNPDPFALAPVRQHRRRHETLCDACKQAERAWTSAMQLQRVARRDGHSDVTARVGSTGTITVTCDAFDTVNTWLMLRPERSYAVRAQQRQ
jgi:hypothetical protein